MKLSAVHLTFLTFVATTSLLTFPANAENLVEVAYSEVNPDWKPYRNGQGVRVLGQYNFMPNVSLFGSYNSAELRTSGPVLSRYETADDWKILGSKADVALSEVIGLHGGLSWQSVKLGGRSRDGYGVHGGFNLRPINWLEFGLDVAYVDLVVEDIALTADLAFRFHEHGALTLRIHDHSDWDFTAYETGLRFYF